MSSSRARILCLHGFRTNADILEMQLQFSLFGDQNIQRLCEFIPIDGTHRTENEEKVPEIIRRAFGPQDPRIGYREWYNRHNETNEYIGIEETLKYINAKCEELGPFDGILGFSQGGALALYLIAEELQRREKGGIANPDFPIRDNLKSLKFGIIIGAGAPRNAYAKENLYIPKTKAGQLPEATRAQGSENKHGSATDTAGATESRDARDETHGGGSTGGRKISKESNLSTGSQDNQMGRYTNFPVLFMSHADDTEVPSPVTEDAMKFFRDDTMFIEFPKGGHRIPALSGQEYMNEVQDWLEKRVAQRV